MQPAAYHIQLHHSRCQIVERHEHRQLHHRYRRQKDQDRHRRGTRRVLYENRRSHQKIDIAPALRRFPEPLDGPHNRRVFMASAWAEPDPGSGEIPQRYRTWSSRSTPRLSQELRHHREHFFPEQIPTRESTM